MILSEWIKKHDGTSKKGHLKVFAEYNSQFKPFPQKFNAFRNVKFWVLLEDGSACGINESPRNGISFPLIGKKTVRQILGDEIDTLLKVNTNVN